MIFDVDQSTEIIVFTGPESSGKTTCANKITQQYQLPLVAEYAREYLAMNGSSYTLEDIKNIAARQIEMETKAHSSHPLIICDTDLITLDIWALEKFGVSLQISDTLHASKHYFLCYPDIPWEPDPLRENPEDRNRLFDVYHSYLQKINAAFTVLQKEDRSTLSFK